MTVLSKTSAEVSRERRIFLRYICLSRVKGRMVAEFKPSKNAKPLARIGIRAEYFNKFAEIFKLEIAEVGERGVVYATDRDEVFDLALLYACILRVLRDKKMVNVLVDVLQGLHPFELVFWNYKLINARDRYEQDRIARAFLMLYGVR